jgi:hypothetical protein
MMKLTKSERMELQRQANARNGCADSARRARLMLLLADGCTWAEIRPKLDCGDSYVSRWSKRFEADRLAGFFCATCRASALQSDRACGGPRAGVDYQTQAGR